MLDTLSTFQLVGLVVAIILASIIVCIITYTFNLLWFLCLPCRGMYYCCGKMKYDDDDEGVMCCDGHCIV